MDVRQLISSCVEVYKAFKPAVMSVDTHAEEWLNQQGVQEEGDRVFIHQVFYGLVRYKKMIKVVISSFFNLHGHQISRLDQDDFMVLVYLVVLRLEEMTWKEFMRFIKSFDALRMFVFLSFVFDEDNISTYFREEWLKIYNIDFVDNVLIAGLVDHIDQAQDVIRKLEAKVGPSAVGGQEMSYEEEDEDESVTGKSRRKEVTHPEPFNLTRPHVTRVPEPEAISSIYVAKPVPSTTYTEDLDTVHALEDKKRSQRKKKKEEYERSKPFSFIEEKPVTPKSKSKKKHDALLDDDLDEMLSRGSMTAREGRPRQKTTKATIPQYGEAPPIKMTVTQILREDALFRKRQEEEMKILQQYERELRDPTEHIRRMEQLQIEDEAKRIAELDRRRIEAQISAEEAAAAKVRAAERKKEEAETVREENKRLREEKTRSKREELARSRRVVQSVQQDVREGARQKKKRMEEEARRRAEEMAEERKAAETARRVAAAKEKRRKADNIREMRAAELVPKKVVKSFDSSTTAGHGLLSEMSIAESRDRLAMNKRRDAALLEDRREQLLSERQMRDAKIVAKLNALARYRNAADREATARAQRLEEAREKAIEEEERRLDDHRLKLQSKIVDKRTARAQERSTLRADERRSKIRTQLRAGDAHALEEESYMQLERATERTAKTKQDRKLASRKQAEEAKARASQSKTSYKSMIEADRRRKDDEHKDRVTQSKIEASERRQADATRRQEIVTRERERYAAQTKRGRAKA